MKYVIISALLFSLTGCEMPQDSNEIQSKQQESLLKEATSQTGMPAIKNFRERRLLKMIYELRDQDGLVTYTYIVPQQTGKPVFLCQSHGFAINDATGYTNPDKVMRDNTQVFGTMTQAEPNGLFTPDSSNAYWVMCLDEKGEKARPMFVASQIIVTPMKLAN